MTSETLPDAVDLDVQPSISLDQLDVERPVAREPSNDLARDAQYAQDTESMHDASSEETPVNRATEHPLPPPPPLSAASDEPFATNHVDTPAIALPEPSESTSSLQEIPLDPPPPPPVPKSPTIVTHTSNGKEPPEPSQAPLPQPLDPAKSVRTPPPRSASLSSNTSMHHRSLTMSQGNTLSVVLISSALDTIAASREAKKSTTLRDSTQRALEMIRAGQGGDKPREIFEPLKLACETRNEKLMIASLDCISKLISHSFFVESAAAPLQYSSPPNSPGGATFSSDSLPDLVAHTITSAYTETTPDAVSLQIVKALLALVLSPTILVHHSSLLKAVRTVYNVFLLSQDPVNQMVAQGGLTQMVNHVFSRCKISDTSVSKVNGHSASIDSPSSPKDRPKHLSLSEGQLSRSSSTLENDPSTSHRPSQEIPNGATVHFITKLNELESDQASATGDAFTASDLTQSKADAAESSHVDDDATLAQSEVLNDIRNQAQEHEEDGKAQEHGKTQEDGMAPEDSKAPPPKDTITLWV